MARKTKQNPCSNQREQLQQVQPNRKQHHPPGAPETHEPLRRSARLRERNLNQDIPKINKALQTPLKPARSASRKPNQLKQKRRNIPQKGKNTLISASKFPKKDSARALIQNLNRHRNKFIEIWMSDCAQLAEKEELLESPSESMPQSARILALRRESRCTSAVASSNASKGNKTIGVARPGFRTVLGDHNIYIGEKDPTPPLLKQAKKIISEPHQSSEMDDAIVLLLKTNLKRVAAQGEDALIGVLGIDLFPAMRVIPDPRIEARINETWDNAIAIALPPGPASSTILPPLPKPKPDLVFGYSKTAFDFNQRSVIRLLSNISGSYAMPAEGLIFPFLQIEFKAFATGGNPFVAENQAANGGAIAMNGLLKLNMGILGEPIPGSDSPHFFSVTLNNKFASVNAHWLSRSADDEPICYHMATLSDYLLTESGGLRAVHQIVKNILDHAVNKRLPLIRKALDTYNHNLVGEQENANHAEEPLLEPRQEEEEEEEEEEELSSQQSDAPVHSVSHGQSAKRRKLENPAQGDMEEDSADHLA